ncbi:TonB-dependent hemoglobin/transferrin/lactoferrin family receptor [Hyphomonadaceae bacterium BL14]|nr:TonB-dependent hemoglobin/transferrin/lactoferrin family receptor [Hyphomonadaceae bacterium BL14]
MSFTRSMRVWLAASAAAAPLALGAPALAEAEADASPGAEASDVIVVTTTRTQLSNFDYPGMASALTLETLEQVRPIDLAELLRDTPGVEVAGGPRRTGQTIRLRGFGRENVTLLVDGARQNFSSAHDGVLFLDPGLLRRVETLRGSASALYGSGASGGVIAFETLRADDILPDGRDLGARASAGYRTGNEETRGSAALFGRSGVFDGMAAISLRESGDIALGSGQDLPADDDTVSGLVSGGADLGGGLRLEAGWLGFRNSAVEPNNGQDLSVVNSLNPLVDKDITADSWRARALFDPETALIAMDVTLYRNEASVDETEQVSGRVVGRDLTTTGVRAENRAAFSLGAAELALVTGAEWYRDRQTGFDSNTPDNARGGVPTGEAEFAGAWAQLETTLDLGGAGALTLLPGVRYDRFETETVGAPSTSDEEVSSRLAASWAPVPSVRLFASWSQSFRAPSLNELYLTGTHFSLPHPVLGPRVFITNAFIPNPDLRPETSTTAEIGAAFTRQGLITPDDRLELKGAWFRTRADDLINLGVDFAFSPTCFAPPFFQPCSAGTSFSENVADAELTGFEIAAAYSSGPFSLSGSVSNVDGEDRATGAPLGALQPVNGQVSARYRFEAWGLDAGARLRFAGEFDQGASPAEDRGGYGVLDLSAGWQPGFARDVRVNVGVENVFDRDYERVFAGVSEPGRTLRVDLTWTGAW